MSNEELIQAGLAAIKAGQIAQASALFAQAVRADPTSEQGWLLLGKCCSRTDQKEYCFRRVLQINPYNNEAKLQLEALLNPPVTPPLSNATKPAPSTLIETPNQQKPILNPVGSVSPFLSSDTPPEIAQKSALHTPVQRSPLKASSGKDLKRKSTKKVLGILQVFLLILTIVCIAGGAYIYFSGMATKWLTPGPIATPIFIQHSSQTDVPPTPTITLTATSRPTNTTLPTAKPTIAYTPVYEEVPCKFDKPKGVAVNCGYLSVPENRTDPHSSQIQIAVAVFHSTNANPSPDPVIFLQGGPGGEAIMTSVSNYSILVEPFLRKHDYIAFDQRGTGMSKPAIGCDELETVAKQDIFGQIPASSRNMIYTNAFRSCHGMMIVSGINPNDFNTVTSADDLKDLVTALGYKQVDLYAASYGTRLALVTMHNHPEILRSVVLDSVVPVESRFYYEDPVRYNSALQALFNGCAANPKCSSAYPNLEADFWNLVSQLDLKPVSVTAPLLTGGKITETVTGSDLLGTITLGLLKYAWMIPAAPMSLDQIKAGDYSTFVAMQSSLPDEFKGINIGVYISMMCHEHILAGTPQELQSVMDSQHDIGASYHWLFYGDAKDMFNTCKVWGATPPAAGEKDPVVSDIPSLILEGAYDPVTPPLFGKQVAQHLKNSYYVEFPNQGHTPLVGDSTGCASKMVLAFFDDPGHQPDRACLANLAPVSFLIPYTGNPPVKLAVEQGLGLTAKMPIEWDKFFDGYYRRDNSTLDITQIAIIRTFFIDSTTLLDSMSSKLYGYDGFDSAPTMVGIRKANDLAWSLYKTTSYGRPVDLAVADSPQGDAMVVLLFCHKDEHDALYQTVYLPIIDSVKPAP